VAKCSHRSCDFVPVRHKSPEALSEHSTCCPERIHMYIMLSVCVCVCVCVSTLNTKTTQCNFHYYYRVLEITLYFICSHHKYTIQVESMVTMSREILLQATYLMDSSTVCLCSAAFRRICSRMMSAFSRSRRPRAFDSASTRSISFLCLSCISCSMVAEADTATEQLDHLHLRR